MNRSERRKRKEEKRYRSFSKQYLKYQESDRVVAKLYAFDVDLFTSRGWIIDDRNQSTASWGWTIFHLSISRTELENQLEVVR